MAGAGRSLKNALAVAASAAWASGGNISLARITHQITPMAITTNTPSTATAGQCQTVSATTATKFTEP